MPPHLGPRRHRTFTCTVLRDVWCVVVRSPAKLTSHRLTPLGHSFCRMLCNPCIAGPSFGSSVSTCLHAHCNIARGDLQHFPAEAHVPGMPLLVTPVHRPQWRGRRPLLVEFIEFARRLASPSFGARLEKLWQMVLPSAVCLADRRGHVGGPHRQEGGSRDHGGAHRPSGSF